MEDITKTPCTDLQKAEVMANENTLHLIKLNANDHHPVVNVTQGEMKDDNKKKSWKFCIGEVFPGMYGSLWRMFIWLIDMLFRKRKPTYHICGSHHNHTSEGDMQACNKVLAFQLEQEEKIRQERQKLAEMDKMIEFSAKHQEHLVRKHEKLEELWENSMEGHPRAKMLKDVSEDRQPQPANTCIVDPSRHQGIDVQNPKDLKKVNEVIEAINEGK